MTTAGETPPPPRLERPPDTPHRHACARAPPPTHVPLPIPLPIPLRPATHPPPLTVPQVDEWMGHLGGHHQGAQRQRAQGAGCLHEKNPSPIFEKERVRLREEQPDDGERTEEPSDKDGPESDAE